MLELILREFWGVFGLLCSVAFWVMVGMLYLVYRNERGKD